MYMLQVLPQTEVLFSQDEVDDVDTAAREELRAAVIEVRVVFSNAGAHCIIHNWTPAVK